MAEREKRTNEFLKLLSPNQKRILTYILCYIPDRNNAEDVLQSTISVLWDKFDQYKPGTDFVAWGKTVARYEVMTFFKKQKKNGKFHFDEDLQEIIETESKAVNDQFDDRIEALRKCLDKLARNDIRVLDLRYQRELTFERIADQLGISSVAVFKKISKIHSRLVRCIRLRLIS